MALKLNVSLNGHSIQNLDLDDPNTTYWAGRGESSQIKLDSFEGISRQHFKITFSDEKWILEVVSRFNEVKVGVESHRILDLTSGLSFTLPPYMFNVEDTASASMASAANENERPVKSGVPHTLEQPFPGEESPNLSLQDEQTKTLTQAISKSIHGVLYYKAPTELEPRMIPMKSDVFIVGRDESSSVIVEDPRFSRRQFQISRVGQRFYIKDFLGANSTFLNKEKITTAEPIELQSGDQLVVLKHKFLFEIYDSNHDEKVKGVEHFAAIEPPLPSEFSPPEFDPHIHNYDGASVGLGDPPIFNPPPGPFSSVPSAHAGVYGANPYNSSNTASSYQSQSEGIKPPSSEKVLKFGRYQIPLTKQNKIRIGLGLAIFLLVVILGSEDNSGFNEESLVASTPADPLEKLSPEERAQLKTHYQLANDLYEKGSFQLAKDEIEKVLAKVPSYENSADLLKEIDLKIASLRDREEAEKARREAQELDERITNIANFCRQQVQINTTMEQIDECLKEAIALNPEHPLLVKVREDVRLIDENRKREEAERLLRESQIAQLRESYKKASELSLKEPLKGIEAFEDFLKLGMPDPDNLKQKAKNEIVRLRRKIKDRVAQAIKRVRPLVESGNYKEAILNLEKAQLVSPTDATLEGEIERLMTELRLKMQVIYQESVVEESIGNLDSAKEMWKKIMNQDVPNGEYYLKAKTRLTRIGAI